jgi:hypothetical protein
MTDENSVCRICGQTFSWHQDNRPRHPFIEKHSDRVMPLGKNKEEKKQQDKPKKVVLETREWPSDPILRIALVKKGILTQADILAAEAELREAAESGGVIQVAGRHSGESSGEDVRVGNGRSAIGSMRVTRGPQDRRQEGTPLGPIPPN